jgi:hypothetical protein
MGNHSWSNPKNPLKINREREGEHKTVVCSERYYIYYYGGEGGEQKFYCPECSQAVAARHSDEGRLAEW